MKNGVKLFISGAVGAVFGAAAITSGMMLLGQHGRDSEQNLLDAEEHRLAAEFVSNKFLKDYPDLVPHQKFIIQGAKFFLEENESVLCPARGKPICKINETHELALLRTVVEEAISIASVDTYLDPVRKELEGLLKKSDTPEAEPAAPDEDITGATIRYNRVRFPSPSL